MLSNGFDAPLHLKLKASIRLLIFQGAVYVLAVIAMLLPSSLPWYVKLIISLLLCANMLFVVIRYFRQQNSSVLLSWHKQTGWKEQTLPNSTLVPEEWLWSSQQRLIITPWFVLFKLINDKDQKQRLIVQDQCENKDDFRRLRVLLECLSESPEQKTKFSFKLPGLKKD